jgi:hypothetical protein
MFIAKTSFVVASAGLAVAAHGTLIANFEPPTYAGSAAGTALAGQDGWFTPVTAPVSNPGNVYTYAGNAFGLVANPTGGTQFAGVSNAGTSLGRAQHAVDFSIGGTWTASWDICVDRFGGVLPAINNIASFSLQNSATSRFFQTLNVWDNLATGNAWDAQYGVHAATGGAVGFVTPANPAWENLNLNTWYRQSTTWDFTTNRILSISIDNLHDAAPATVLDVSGLAWFLAGGANSTLPLPTDIRLFAGGGANNTHVTGWDNLSVVPSPGALALVFGGVLLAARRRR